MLAKYLESLQWKSLWSCKTLFLVCRHLGWVFPCKNKKNYKLSFPLKFLRRNFTFAKAVQISELYTLQSRKNCFKILLRLPCRTNFGPSSSTEGADKLEDKAHKSAANLRDSSHLGLSMGESFPFHSVPSSPSNPTASFSLEVAVLPSLPTRLWTALFWWKESIIICVTTVF